jgi:hypothetical protein
MIQYFHTTARPPPWLLKARNLAHRQVAEGTTFGVGTGWMLQPPPEGALLLSKPHDYRVWMNDDGPSPEGLTRASPWCGTQLVLDGEDRIWTAPVILDAQGQRAFKVRYDSAWKPALTPAQEDLLVRAQETRLWLDGYARTGEAPDSGFGAATAAHFLSEANHITTEVIGALQLMDDVLMLATLLAAVSRDPESMLTTHRKNLEHG